MYKEYIFCFFMGFLCLHWILHIFFLLHIEYSLHLHHLMVEENDANICIILYIYIQIERGVTDFHIS